MLTAGSGTVKTINSRGAWAAVPLDRPPKKRKRCRGGVRSAAIGVTVRSGGGNLLGTLSGVLKRAREKIPLGSLGISAVRLLRAAGGILMEISGPDTASKVDALVAYLRKIFMASVRVSHPVQKINLWIEGFDDSVTPAEIATAISQFEEGVRMEDVRVGAVRPGAGSLCAVRIQVLAAAAVAALAMKRVWLIWATARVVPLKGGSLQCYRCLATRHLRKRCPSLIERTRCCNNWRGRPHRGRIVCHSRPHCPMCVKRGRSVSHKSSPAASPCPPRR